MPAGGRAARPRRGSALHRAPPPGQWRQYPPNHVASRVRGRGRGHSNHDAPPCRSDARRTGEDRHASCRARTGRARGLRDAAMQADAIQRVSEAIAKEIKAALDAALDPINHKSVVIIGPPEDDNTKKAQ